MVIQELLLAAVQVQPVPTVTLIVPEAPEDEALLLPEGDMEYAQPEPWWIAKEVLAMVMEPSRASPVGFAATE